MALFESYERRIDTINSVLTAFLLLKKLKKSQKMLALMFTNRLRKSSRFVLKMPAGLIQ